MGHNETANPPRPATLVRPKGKKSDEYKKILLEKFFQQCQDNILYVYLDVGVGRVGIDVFYE
jgi:hypothetical protein